MSGKFYGIGVGPGDPELITMKAVNILKSADVVAVPESSKEKGSVALDIARPYLRDGVEMLTLTFPMIRDVAAKQRIREENAQKVLAEIQQGKTIAFLTLGDPMLYSTYIYLLRELQAIDREARVVTVPGVTAFSAAAALTNRPVGEGKQLVTIVPASDDFTQLAEALDRGGTVVLMKVNKSFGKLVSLLEDMGLLSKAVYVSRCGTDKEKIIRDLFAYITEHPEGYVKDYPAGDPLILRAGDFIAGMTDRYAMALYEQVFLPKAWPIL